MIYDVGGFILRKFKANLGNQDDLTTQFEKVIKRAADRFLTANRIVQTSDGGYLVSGVSSVDRQNVGEGFNEAALIKLKADGSVEFASLVGGPNNEGTNFNNGPSTGTHAVQAADGGYAFTCPTTSYKTGTPEKPDWLIVKTDSQRKVQNFGDILYDLPLSAFITKDTTRPGEPQSFTRISPDVVRPMVDKGPIVLLEHPGQYAAPNAPSVKFQAPPFLGGVMPPPIAFTVATTAPTSPDDYDNHRLWRFETIDTLKVSGRTLRVQYSRGKPVREDSWQDIPTGAQMTLVDPTSSLYRLESTHVVPDQQDPNSPRDDYYFRVIASAPSYHSGPTPFSDRYSIFQLAYAKAQLTSSIAAPMNGATYLEGSAVTIKVNATEPQFGVQGGVALIDNGVLLARIPYSPFEYTINHISAGRHTIVAVAMALGQTQASAPVSIFVSGVPGANYTFNGSGDWFSPSSWTPNGVPGAQDSARINSGSLTVSQNATVRNVTMNGGTISGPGAITLTQNGVVAAGSLANVTLNVGRDAQVSWFTNDAKGLTGTTINNAGSFLVSGGNLNGDAQTKFVNTGHFAFTTQEFPGGATIASFGSFANNSGVVSLEGGTLVVQAGYTQSAGEIDLGAVDASLLQGVVSGSVTLNGGSLTGSGTIAGDLANASGFVAPGHSLGTIHVTGNYIQSSGGTLIAEVYGEPRGGLPTADLLDVGGNATLGGKLDVPIGNPVTLDGSKTAKFLEYGSRTGSFASTSSNAQLVFDLKEASLKVDGTLPAPASGALLNISTRMKVETGDNVLDPGFIVLGPSGSTKKVMIRGLGPSLQGVSGALVDPLLELHNPDGSTVTNDDWQQGDTSQIPPGFSPGSPKESVIIADLAPGTYSAILKGAHGETGIALAELYDLDQSSPAKIVNISTRGLVQTGNNVLIGGFIIGQTEPANILVRALGPSLPLPTGALADPVLEIHDKNGAVYTNDDWRATQEAEILDTGVPPVNDAESAMVVTLVPGTYTAIVRGKANTTGVALFEAYNLR